MLDRRGRGRMRQRSSFFSEKVCAFVNRRRRRRRPKFGVRRKTEENFSRFAHRRKLRETAADFFLFWPRLGSALTSPLFEHLAL